MHIEFDKVAALVRAYDDHVANLDGKYNYAAKDSASTLVAAAREAGQYVTGENVKAICRPVDDLNAIIIDVDFEGDHELADGLRHQRDAISMIVARRLVQAFTPQTALERQLRASVDAGERGAKFAAITREAFPSEVPPYDVTSSDAKVVPMHAKGE